MGELLETIQFKIFVFIRRFPVFFARHAWSIFLGGAILILILGVWVFYQNSYQVVQATYDPFVSIKKINKTLYQEALNFLETREESPRPLPLRDPFGE